MSTRQSIPATLTSQELFNNLTQLIAGLRFGTIELTIHDGRVVQIERREKIRLDQRSTTPVRNNS